MKISVDQLAKKYWNQVLFKGFNYTFEGTNRYALLGANGSGKSTMLRILAAIQNASKGKIVYSQNNQEIASERFFNYYSICAPGIELVEEMTLEEFFKFHFSFKPLHQQVTQINELYSIIGLAAFKSKALSHFSSGMKQRVKLAQAIFTDCPILLLDEPCTNLDIQGVNQYQQWIEQYATNKMIIVASNEEREYSFCDQKILLSDYLM